jgi:hypothetical protein
MLAKGRFGFFLTLGGCLGLGEDSVGAHDHENES